MMNSKIFEPYQMSINDVFDHIYSVPVYQRPYSWEYEQINVLIDDLFNAFNSDERNDGYYVGNIIVQDTGTMIEGQKRKYDIIDGQQRMTTFVLILLSLYGICASNGIGATDSTLFTLRQTLWKEISRQQKKEYRVVNLNSIEKNVFKNLCDACFDDPKNIYIYAKNCKVTCKTKFDARVINNFLHIYDLICARIGENNIDTMLDFADFVLTKVQLIVIFSSCNACKVFSMFEAINSKGKKLESIDLIKTYIFSQLDKDDYDSYLQKWGQLIIDTGDKLFDYLTVYVKAYLHYYRQSIDDVKFKNVIVKELCNWKNTNNVQDAIKFLLDDMYAKVKYYNMLTNLQLANKLVCRNKFEFYMQAFKKMDYQYPKALFFRLFIELDENKVKKEDVTEIVCQVIQYMLYSSISGRESKLDIDVFKDIQSNIYEKGKIFKELVIRPIASELYARNENNESMVSKLKDYSAYNSNGAKKLTAILLSLYEGLVEHDGEYRVSYDRANLILASFDNHFSLDHMLPQTPDVKKGYKYLKDANTNKLVLLDGNDFPEELASTGMDYDVFCNNILNKIGNLRIWYMDDNSSRHNDVIQLKNEKPFYDYTSLKNRSECICHDIINKCIPLPKIDISLIKSVKKSNKDLPKMDVLIEEGLINIGDKVYIEGHANDSTAILLDGKYVDYHGEKLTINDWGCKITGWKSICIYEYMYIVGDPESLQSKRKKYVQTID